MKKIIIASAVALFAAGAVYAQGGTMGKKEAAHHPMKHHAVYKHTKWGHKKAMHKKGHMMMKKTKKHVMHH